MTSMVDAVAKAIWDKRESWFPGFTQQQYAAGTDLARDGTRALARAAIEAMREPTLAMNSAGDEVYEDRILFASDAGHLCVWEAMIEAALAE